MLACSTNPKGLSAALTIIGAFVEAYNKSIFGAVQHSIIGRFLSTISLPLCNTFSSTHPHIYITSHLHPLHPPTFTSTHLHIYTPSHLHTLTLHTLTSSHTAAEFISKLAAVEEQHAQQLNNVVKTFRRRTNETLRRES